MIREKKRVYYNALWAKPGQGYYRENYQKQKALKLDIVQVLDSIAPSHQRLKHE
jgi:hypothetical protein